MPMRDAILRGRALCDSKISEEHYHSQPTLNKDPLRDALLSFQHIGLEELVKKFE